VSLSLHIYAPIETEKLAESLYRPLHSAWDFDDWTGFGFGSRVEDLFSADRTTPDVAATYLDTLRAMRADHHAWYCSGAILLRNGSSQVIGPDSEPIAKIISHALMSFQRHSPTLKLVHC